MDFLLDEFLKKREEEQIHANERRGEDRRKNAVKVQLERRSGKDRRQAKGTADENTNINIKP